MTPAATRRIRREPERGRYDRESLHAVLDAQHLAHVAWVLDGEPQVVPMLAARIGDRLAVHGSSASRTMKALAAGVPACVSVAVVDGLVLAKSVFDHSVNYRGAVIYGRFEPVVGDDALMAAFEALTEALAPGRWAEARRPSPKEMRATAVVTMPLDDATVKVREGGPSLEDLPASAGVWAGVVPFEKRYGEAVPATDGELPPSVRALSGTPTLS
ncbi:pyridoxamine 5'-phosphate oxidase family protein [Jatrophihabitans fulvus]